MGCQYQGGQTFCRRRCWRRRQGRRLQGPMGGTSASTATGSLIQDRVVQQPDMHECRLGDGQFEPAVHGQLLPYLGAPVQAHAAQQAGRQPGTAVGVGAQGALQGKQPGGGGSDAAKSGCKVGEHLPHAPGLVVEVPLHHRRGSDRAARSEQGVGHGRGAAGCGSAGPAGIGQPPGATAAITRERKQHWSGAPAVPRVPRTAPLTALTDPQMPREGVSAGMAGQMRQRSGPRGSGRGERRMSGAVRTDQAGTVRLYTQLHRPACAQSLRPALTVPCFPLMRRR